MLAVSITEKGHVRSQNQDTIFCSPGPVGPLPNLFVVADGMGGHNAGDIASRQAAEVFCGHIANAGEGRTDFMDLMVDAANAANKAIYDISVQNPACYGMGTTLSACVIYGGRCDIVHIGDSRVYMITKEAITQLTTDHSYVNELVKAGRLTQQEAINHPKRNILTRVMGTEPDKEFDGYPCAIEDGCAVLLCSDGLTNMLSDEEIFNIVNSEKSADERTKELTAQANLRGGLDNISVVLIDTKE